MFEVWCRVQESTYELGWKMNCWWIYVATLAERQLDTSACGKPLSARGVLMNFHFELREADKLAFSLRIPHSAEGKFLLGFRP